MSQENVLFQTNGFSGGKLAEPDQIKWSATFIVSNAATIDLSITNIYCTNYQNEPWKATTFRPCEILQPKAVPFVLKAGDSIVIQTEASFQAKGKAKTILEALIKKPDATLEQYEEALTKANTTTDDKSLYDKPSPQSDKFYSFGAGMSGGEKLGLLDRFK